MAKTRAIRDIFTKPINSHDSSSKYPNKAIFTCNILKLLAILQVAGRDPPEIFDVLFVFLPLPSCFFVARNEIRKWERSKVCKELGMN